MGGVQGASWHGFSVHACPKEAQIERGRTKGNYRGYQAPLGGIPKVASGIVPRGLCRSCQRTRSDIYIDRRLKRPMTTGTTRAIGVSDREAGLRTRLIYWLVKRRLGRISRGVRLRARDPKLLEVAARMDLHTAASFTVPANLKELAQIKVAVMVGCPF